MRSQKDYDLISQQVYLLQNKVRENPQSLIPELELRIQNMNGKVLTLSNGKQITTREGSKAIEECIQFLSRQQPLYSLKLEEKLSMAAYDHASDIGWKGVITHQGTDGSTLKHRVEKYGKWKQLLGENMSFGIYDPKEIVLQLIIDDGVQGRGHRNNVFTAAYGVVGISFTYHAKYNICGVIDYAGQFYENELQILKEQVAKIPALFPQSPPSERKFQEIAEVEKELSERLQQQPPPQPETPKIQSSKKTSGKKKIDQILSLDLNKLSIKKTPPQVPKDASPQSSNKQEKQVNEFNLDFHNEEQTIKVLEKEVKDEIGEVKKNLQIVNPQSSKQSDRFMSFSIPQDKTNNFINQINQYHNTNNNQFIDNSGEPSFRQTNPQSINRNKVPPVTIPPKSTPTNTQASLVGNLLNNFLERRQQAVVVKPPSSVNSSLIHENQPMQTHPSEAPSVNVSQRDPELLTLIERLYLRAMQAKEQSKSQPPPPPMPLPTSSISKIQQYKIPQNMFQITKSADKIEQQTTVKKSTEYKPVLNTSQETQSYTISMVNFEEPIQSHSKSHSVELKKQPSSQASDSKGKKNVYEPSTKLTPNNKNDKKLTSTPKPQQKQQVTPRGRQQQHQPKQNFFSKNDRQTPQNQSTSKSPNKGNKTPRSRQQEEKIVKIMGINEYLFVDDQLYGTHKLPELRNIPIEDIYHYYQKQRANYTYPKIEDLLKTYKYEELSAKMAQQDPKFFTLCKDNFNFYVIGELDSQRRRWTRSYMPKENLNKYLMSLGFMIDEQVDEYLNKLIQGYYRPQQQPTVKRAILSRKPSMVQHPSAASFDLKGPIEEYTFDGVLLCVHACQIISPNPSGLLDYLQYLDQKQTGVIDRTTINDILTNDGLNEEEIQRFLDEFDEWQKERNKRAKQIPKSQNPHIAVYDAFRVLTLSPY